MNQWTGGFKLKHGEAISAKPLQRVAVNATGHCDEVWSALSEKCTVARFDDDNSHVLVEIRIRSSHIFREWLAAAKFGSMQLGAMIKCLAAYQKNAHSHGTFS